MSLIDSLLLEPYRLNVWIARRTDGIKGTGTVADPFPPTVWEDWALAELVPPTPYERPAHQSLT